jgi:hypothetical protein
LNVSGRFLLESWSANLGRSIYSIKSCMVSPGIQFECLRAVVLSVIRSHKCQCLISITICQCNVDDDVESKIEGRPVKNLPSFAQD